jgi:hypothetical protein
MAFCPHQPKHYLVNGGGFLHASMVCYGGEGHEKELKSW